MTRKSIFSETILLQKFHYLKMNLDVLKRLYIHSNQLSPSRKFNMYRRILHLKKQADYIELRIRKKMGNP